MTSPTVRQATAADLPQILALLTQLSLDGPREDVSAVEAYRKAFAEIERDPRQRLLVLESDGRIVGTAVLIIIPNLSHRGRPWALAENVVVDETARSAGYGELLMRRALEEARTAGCYKLTLTSSKRRLDAHRFYARLGFRATHEGFRFDF